MTKRLPLVACFPAGVSIIIPSTIMPFSRKTPRRPRRHVITLSHLTTANWQVMDELDNLGFWHKRLEDIDVYLVPASFACYGWYPNYRQVVPTQAKEMAVIPHDRRPGLIAWLRSLKSGNRRDPSVRLDWNKRGQLTLTHRDAEGRSAILHVPVEIHGKPPVIGFNPDYLAQALQIGSTLCLHDELNPGTCRHPNGRFCVLMPMRVAISSATDTPEASTPTGVAQAA